MVFKPGEVTTGQLHCKILRPVSKGQMSETYLAGLKNTEWKVLIKAAGPEQKAILYQEAKLLAGLRAKGIPEVYDFMEERERSYYIMPFYEGRNLKKGISQSEILTFALELCGILTYLHTRPVPVIHNDIKPANILLQKEGGWMLLDFGAAKVLSHKERTIDTGKENNIDTSTKKVFQGTLGYAAPECWHHSNSICPATDVFALGATLYYLLEGKEPQKCFGKYELSVTSIESEKKKNRWQPVLNKCTALNLKDRYQSAVQMYQDLEKIMI